MAKARKIIEEELEKEIEKKVEKGIEKFITILVSVTITFVVSVIIFKFVWAWVVPDLFPAAVEQGLISANLTWLSAVKLAVLVAVLSGFGPTLDEAFKQRK